MTYQQNIKAFQSFVIAIALIVSVTIGAYVFAYIGTTYDDFRAQVVEIHNFTAPSPCSGFLSSGYCGTIGKAILTLRGEDGGKYDEETVILGRLAVVTVDCQGLYSLNETVTVTRTTDGFGRQTWTLPGPGIPHGAVGNCGALDVIFN